MTLKFYKQNQGAFERRAKRQNKKTENNEPLDDV